MSPAPTAKVTAQTTNRTVVAKQPTALEALRIYFKKWASQDSSLQTKNDLVQEEGCNVPL